MKDLWCGIDAGTKGGIALLDSQRGFVTLSLGSATEAETMAFLKSYASRISLAAIERVWMMTGDSPNVGKLIQSYGFLRGLLNAFDVPFDDPAPQKWMGKLGCSTGGDKRVSKQYIQQRYPAARFTNGTADAGCLAHYAMLTSTRVRSDDTSDGISNNSDIPAWSIFAGNPDSEAPSEATLQLKEFNKSGGE